MRGRTVLDAGCGLGHGLGELRSTAAKAIGQDLDPRLKAEGILIGGLEELPAKSYDVVVSIDVIEHVGDDEAFLCHLSRIAKEMVFLTTPLSVHGRARWPYHVREYRAQEFLRIVRPFGDVTYYVGTSSGSQIFEVSHMAYFRLIDGLINSPLFNLPVRAAQKLLPRRLRYHAHQAALIRIAN